MNIPEDLTALEYARHILEYEAGMPAKGNIELVADCITSISKAKRLTIVKAYAYLARAVRMAKEQGKLVNVYFFRDGDYMNVRPITANTGSLKEYVPIDKKAVQDEQNSELWEEESRKARETLARIAGKKAML